MESGDIRLLLESELPRAGLELPAGSLDRLVRHYELLVKWNRAVRLVGSTNPEIVVRRHILESLALLPHVPQRAGSLLDIGAGNGYPAIPLKCALPDLRLGMIEPTQRKCIFLGTVIRDLGLTDSQVYRDRIDRPRDLANYGIWDCISMRAVAALRSVMMGAPSALRPGGRLLLLVGAGGRQEILSLLAPPLHLVADTMLAHSNASYLVVVGMAPPPPNVPRGTKPTIH